MMRVDGREVPARGTVLEACRLAGADVPAFCFDARTDRGGHCRGCLVEVGGRFVAACSVPSADGLEVRTDTDALREYRRDLGELMRAESAPGGNVAATLASLGVTGERYRPLPVAATPAAEHPYLRIDLSKCIKCRLCIRVCDDVQGRFVYAMQGRGARSHVGWAGETLKDAGCVSCGACVAACPTDAITDADRQRARGREVRARVRTTCGFCGVGCQLDVKTDHAEVLWIDGVPDAAVNHGHLCVKGRYAHRFVHHPERLTTPLVRRGGRLEPASWDEAIAYVGREFTRLRGHLAGVSSARCTNEENYLVQKWFRGGLGTNDVDCCARVCHAPTAAGMRLAFGTGAATNSLADIDLADLVLVSGSNATDAHPVTGARIRSHVLGAGARLIVIDPRRTELAELADVHLALRPGTNVPLLHSLAHVIVSEGLEHRAFLDERVDDLDAYRAFIAAWSPEAMEPLTGVPAADVRKAARLYAAARSPLQVHGLGMTEHLQGAESVMLLCNLALLVGAAGRPGVGVNPLRGQNNVQGAVDMGCQPDALTGYARLDDPTAVQRFETTWGRPVPRERGRTIPKMYEAILAGELRGMYILGEDVVQTDPDAHHIREALGRLECLVVQEIFLSDTATLAHVVLPGASYLEKDGTFTNGERRIQRVRQVLAPRAGARADWQILLDLMAATGYPQALGSPSEILDEVARVYPAFAGVSFSALEPDGLQWPVPAPGHPGTPILHVDGFAKGRATLARVEYVPSPALAVAADEFVLVTGRTLEHYNSGSMTRRSPNAELAPLDALEVNPADAARRGLVEGAAVRVRSEFGVADAHVHVTDRVAPGTLFLTFHFPETGTNRVTSDVVDRLVDCPEYKVTRVSLEPLGAAVGPVAPGLAGAVPRQSL